MCASLALTDTVRLAPIRLVNAKVAILTPWSTDKRQRPTDERNRGPGPTNDPRVPCFLQVSLHAKDGGCHVG